MSLEHLAEAVDEAVSIEDRILFAADCEDVDEFLRRADQYGGLERAQALVRRRGYVTRPLPPPRLIEGESL